MKRLMTKEFSKWADKYKLTLSDLANVLEEVEIFLESGTFVEVVDNE